MTPALAAPLFVASIAVMLLASAQFASRLDHIGLRLGLPEALLGPVALVMEKKAALTGIEPLMTRDHLKMARKKMFFSSAKAMRELGYTPRPARAAIEDAIAWFKVNGMLPQ